MANLDELLESLAPLCEAVKIISSDTLGQLRDDDDVLFMASGSWSAPQAFTMGDARKIARIVRKIQSDAAGEEMSRINQELGID